MIVTNIDFSVNQQTIKFSTAAQLVANSAGIATASFSFSTDWLDYDTIKVIFSNGTTVKSRILTAGQYTVPFPSECMTAGRISVSAVGLTGAEGEETFKRATTELNRGVEVIRSGATEGDPADLPTPTQAEQILLLAANANTTAQQANETANTANTTAQGAVTTANNADTKAQTALNHTNTYKGLRLANRTIVPTGETAPVIEIDKYMDGTPLNSVLGGELLFYSGANSSMASVVGCSMQINGITTNNYITGGGSEVNYLNLGNVGNLASSKKTTISLINNNFFSETQMWYKYSSGGSSGSFISGMTTPQTAINAIKLFLSAGTFPAGTVVEWWERG